MADMSPADKTYVAEMTAHHKDAIATAQTYLKAGPGERRANLSEMARKTIKDDTAEMTKMGAMMSKLTMGGK